MSAPTDTVTIAQSELEEIRKELADIRRAMSRLMQAGAYRSPHAHAPALQGLLQCNCHEMKMSAVYAHL